MIDFILPEIGEGIETEKQKNEMLKIGCNIGQGYLMHRPEFLKTLSEFISSIYNEINNEKRI